MVRWCMLIGIGLGLCVAAADAAERTVGTGKTYATIAEAFAAASVGDEIVIDAGTYVETTVLRQNKTGTGTITFRSASGLRDVVWQLATPADTDRHLYMDNATHTVCNGIIFDGGGGTNNGNQGLVENRSQANLTLTNCKIFNTGSGSPGVLMYHATKVGNVTLTGCEIDVSGYGILPLASSGGFSTVTIDGTTITSGTLNAIVVAPGAVTTDAIVITGGSVLTGASNQDAFYQHTTNGGTITTLTIDGGASLVGVGTGKALSIAKTVGTLTLENCTLAGAHGISIASTGAITTLNATGVTCGAIYQLGAVTSLNLTNCTVDGGSAFALATNSGATHGTGTRLIIRGGSFSGAGGYTISKNYAEVCVTGATIAASTGSSPAVLFGIETTGSNSNDAPLGHLHFVGNRVEKSGTGGHCALFAMGGGRGLIADNVFLGGDYGLILKSQGAGSERYTVTGNAIHNPGGVVALYLSGCEYADVRRNTAIGTTGSALALHDNQNNVAARWNTVMHNVLVATSGYAINSSATADADKNLIDHNVYWATGANPFRIAGQDKATLALARTQWSTTHAGELYGANDLNSVFGDPLVRNPAGADFSMPANSPAFGSAGGWSPVPGRAYGTSGQYGTHGPRRR